MAKAVLWVLKGEPKEIVITDKFGAERKPDLDKIKSLARLKGARVAGRYGAGVGPLFYGGRLGLKHELQAKGNKFTTNDEILQAIGYEKTSVELEDPKED